MNLSKEIKESYEYIKSRSKYSPKIGLVLGTGLGNLANEIEEAEYYKYMDIPNFLDYYYISSLGGLGLCT